GHLVPSTLWSKRAATARRSPTLHNSQLQSSPLPHVLLQLSVQSTLIGRRLVAGRRHPCLPCRRSAIGSSSVRSDAGSGGSVDAVHVLATARVIPEDDNEKKPLWRYVQMLENTGKGKGGNKRSMQYLLSNREDFNFFNKTVHLL
uniref:Uncharacterized protein n=1 Tax=Triticum urartu TaxID=4572 RepID=A0A8R7TR63_TRIUA